MIDKFRNGDKRSNTLSFASSRTWFPLSESNAQIKSNMIQFLSANRVAIIPEANSRIIIRLFLYPPQSIYQCTHSNKHTHHPPARSLGPRPDRIWRVAWQTILCLWEFKPLGEILASHANFLGKRIRDGELVSRINSTQL